MATDMHIIGAVTSSVSRVVPVKREVKPEEKKLEPSNKTPWPESASELC
jgi:hypothetical protein